MRLSIINLCDPLKDWYLSGSSAIIVGCILLSAAGLGLAADPNSGINSRRSVFATDSNNSEDCSGPTIYVDYSKDGFSKNPASSFMYFVPLISPTLVDRQISRNNEQQIAVISYERTVTSKSFNVVCEFRIFGKGFQKNTFDPVGMITTHTGQKGQTLTHMLDYIKFEGEGFGRIEVRGTIAGSTRTVNEVGLQFNANGHKSPVTVGLYDVPPKDGQYKYENRTNEIVARVDSLIFKKSENNPRMGMKIASIKKAAEPDCLIGNVKGLLANLFLKPTKVDKLGNDTMLDFGCALLQQKPAFTFPKAKNIKENSTASTIASNFETPS